MAESFMAESLKTGGAMPIKCNLELSAKTQDHFHAIDKVVMRHSFDIHNSLGRFLDESIYQEELRQRCLKSGLNAHSELEIQVSHADFRKSYFLDLLIEKSFIYELKAAVSLNTSHAKQLINYLLLTDLKHGKIINFRPQSLESQFASTRLSRGERTVFQFHDESSAKQGSPIHRLKDTLCELLGDWGTFLEINLYREALLFLMTDKVDPLQDIEIIIDGRIIGSQKMCMLSPESGWHLSATKHHHHSYEAHIRRMLHHTPLESIHWINFNNHQVTLKTLEK